MVVSFDYNDFYLILIFQLISRDQRYKYVFDIIFTQMRKKEGHVYIYIRNLLLRFIKEKKQNSIKITDIDAVSFFK